MSGVEGLQVGVIKWFDKDRGYGFIRMSDGKFDVFVHAKHLRRSGIERALEEGEKVQFVLGRGAKGSFAESITLIDSVVVDAAPAETV